ncbi:MAG: class I SAM-dependent methyltransferase [Chitinophagales bacterium]|nr:class I SAM-dependent methyltransferase [Chitinophagales bacterium]
MDLVEKRIGSVNRHPWELSRAASILKLLKRFGPDKKYADVGAGDVYFAERLSQQVNEPVYVVDIGYTENKRIGNLIQLMNIDDLPEQVDVVLLMDVIEHIDDVDSFLNSLLKKVKPGGQLVITVPAFQFLFSEHDVFLKHYRRYNLSLLHDTVKKQGLVIETSFYFYTLLFFARCLVVAIEKLTKPAPAEGVGNWKYPENHFLTKLIKGILDLDYTINAALGSIGIKFPGLSVCAICKKKS